jgi:hypothetical protein
MALTPPRSRYEANPTRTRWRKDCSPSSTGAILTCERWERPIFSLSSVYSINLFVSFLCIHISFCMSSSFIYFFGSPRYNSLLFQLVCSSVYSSDLSGLTLLLLPQRFSRGGVASLSSSQAMQKIIKVQIVALLSM